MIFRIALTGLWFAAVGARAAEPSGAGVALIHQVSAASFDLPESSREPVDGLIPVPGPWRVVGTVDGVRTWEAPLPVRPRTLFFSRPPDDMAVYRRRDSADGRVTRKNARRLSHGSGFEGWKKDRTWAFSQRAVQVRRAAGQGPPADGEYALRYSRALERERSLNRASSDLDGAAFVVRSLQLDDTTRTGLFLPAPATARFQVDVPPGGVLDLDLLLLPPEVADAWVVSDGADLVVSVGQTEVLRAPALLGQTRSHRVDLSEWGGQSVTLSLATDPGDDAAMDYVFVADPVIFTPSPAPPRVVLVFIDTLRYDHLSLYGYERPTTPALDAWSQDAAVFEQARSVAPWTLPSTRNMLTGTHPELWGSAETLQERFSEQGWATAFLAGNIYLSSNFDMADGWSEHRCVNWPLASVQIDRAFDFLDAHADRPAFLLLHFMDMHLPYTEPLSYRDLFAGDRPDSLSGDRFHRGEVLRAAKGRDPVFIDYMKGRYDNNLRYIDDELARLLDTLGPDTTVVILADHGEEFWDHDAFEHGHSLYDELLHVPLIVKGPGITPGRFDQPVSLMDVAPTIARAAGLRSQGMIGWPLQDLASGERAQEFVDRPQAFGRPLYGDTRWGVLSHGLKYSTIDGKEELYDLSDDPGESRNLRQEADRDPLWRDMAQALDRPVSLGFRLVASAGRSQGDVQADLRVPGGVAVAFMGEDPTNKSDGSVSVVGDVVHMVWDGDKRGVREFFVVPKLLAQDVASQLQLSVQVGGQSAGPDTPESTQPYQGAHSRLLRSSVGGRSVKLGYAVVPEPLDGGIALEGYDPEVRAELEALGYAGH